MFFYVNKKNLSLKSIKSLKKVYARRYILLKPLSYTENILNKYLIKKYNKNLKNICLWLLKNTKFSEDLDGNIIITFRTPEQNKLAELITYGNLEVNGSFILRKAFGERI